MKTLISTLALAMACSGTMAQNTQDTIPAAQPDTIRIGSIIIIKKDKSGAEGKGSVSVYDAPPRKKSRVVTNWGIVDLGFANYNDQTNYGQAGNFLVNRPGYPSLNGNDFKLRTGKSVNVNIWFFMQTLNLIKENVGIKYGLGLELNNYRYKSDITYREDGIVPYSNGLISNAPFIFRDSIAFSKNKLAADYVTIPLMINFATNHKPGRKGFNLAVGVSGGYLYSQRNKQISTERGKQKEKGDFDMERFKFSYIGELGLGPVKFYASYSPQSMYEHSLNMRPYNFGIRFSY